MSKSHKLKWNSIYMCGKVTKYTYKNHYLKMYLKWKIAVHAMAPNWMIGWSVKYVATFTQTLSVKPDHI